MTTIDTIKEKQMNSVFLLPKGDKLILGICTYNVDEEGQNNRQAYLVAENNNGEELAVTCDAYEAKEFNDSKSALQFIKDELQKFVNFSKPRKAAIND